MPPAFHYLWQPAMTVAVLAGVFLAWLYLVHAVTARTLRRPAYPAWSDAWGVLWLAVLVASLTSRVGIDWVSVVGASCLVAWELAVRWKRSRRSR